MEYMQQSRGGYAGFLSWLIIHPLQELSQYEKGSKRCHGQESFFQAAGDDQVINHMTDCVFFQARRQQVADTAPRAHAVQHAAALGRVRRPWGVPVARWPDPAAPRPRSGGIDSYGVG